MTIDTALRDFYQRHGFGDVPGKRPRTVPVYTGCLLVPMPNIETRRKFLKYHDIHHLVTGYSVGRIGEGEISAWELGTGSAYVSPILGVMNLIAFSTGLVLEPRRMWRAYERGCRSRNLYRSEFRTDIDGGRWEEVSGLRDDILEINAPFSILPVRSVLFFIYALLAMIIHAGLAIPAVIVRFLTDIIGGANIFETFKPARRTDLF
jgi:hypothetical protein